MYSCICDLIWFSLFAAPIKHEIVDVDLTLSPPDTLVNSTAQYQHMLSQNESATHIPDRISQLQDNLTHSHVISYETVTHQPPVTSTYVASTTEIPSLAPDDHIIRSVVATTTATGAVSSPDTPPLTTSANDSPDTFVVKKPLVGYGVSSSTAARSLQLSEELSDPVQTVVQQSSDLSKRFAGVEAAQNSIALSDGYVAGKCLQCAVRL